MPKLPKQWWSSPAGFAAQAGCLLALFAWSVHHAPGETAKAFETAPVKVTAPASPETAGHAVTDNQEETASTDTVSGVGARFVAPPRVRFRTEHPPAGSLNLRPLEQEISTPWQPLHPRNPPQRLPSGPRSPFEASGNGATVYNAPPPDAD